MPPAIVLTAFGNIETAIATIHDLGAFWFLEKPIQPAALRILLERASAQSRLAEETERLQRELQYQGVLVDLVGASPAMQQVFSLIRQVAPKQGGSTDHRRERHRQRTGRARDSSSEPAARRARLSLSIARRCPKSLMESELFGHEKGAFTGAIERRAGCFELAQHGTLLLDELAEMPVGTQAKLLRVLEDSRVRRLGGKNEIVVDVRIIASTNKNLEEALRKGELREDLYYRLNVFQITLPPLRQREGDIPVLVEALIRDLNRKHGCKITEASKELLDLLARHNWPGNVRELRNVIERALIIAGEGPLTRRTCLISMRPRATAGERFQRTRCRPPAGGNDGFRGRESVDSHHSAAHEK